jgi:hypothetical protein
MNPAILGGLTSHRTTNRHAHIADPEAR